MILKYDYDRIIVTHKLQSEFHYYCYKHKKVKSLKRLKRAFLISKGFTKKDFIEATQVSSNLQNAINIVKKVSWL